MKGVLVKGWGTAHENRQLQHFSIGGDSIKG